MIHQINIYDVRTTIYLLKDNIRRSLYRSIIGTSHSKIYRNIITHIFERTVNTLDVADSIYREVRMYYKESKESMVKGVLK